MGKKERLRLREKWKTTWSIEKKMQTVILAVIIGMTVIAICVSIFFFYRYIDRAKPGIQRRKAADNGSGV